MVFCLFSTSVNLIILVQFSYMVEFSYILHFEMVSDFFAYAKIVLICNLTLCDQTSWST